MAQAKVMGRVRQYIEVEGRDCWTLFDTGSRNNFVREDMVPQAAVVPLRTPRNTGLGGGIRRVEKGCVLNCEIEGKGLDLYALVLPEIGLDGDGKQIELLFGALEMQRWGIIPDPVAEKIDLRHYPEMWVEFPEVGP